MRSSVALTYAKRAPLAYTDAQSTFVCQPLTSRPCTPAGKPAAAGLNVFGVSPAAGASPKVDPIVWLRVAFMVARDGSEAAGAADEVGAGAGAPVAVDDGAGVAAGVADGAGVAAGADDGAGVAVDVVVVSVPLGAAEAGNWAPPATRPAVVRMVKAVARPTRSL